MKKSVIVFTTVAALAVAGIVYGFTSSNSAHKNGCCKPDGVTCVDYNSCPKKGQPDCPMLENCPKKGQPDCPLVNGGEESCCKKK